jgi:hypothetical protein
MANHRARFAVRGRYEVVRRVEELNGTGVGAPLASDNSPEERILCTDLGDLFFPAVCGYLLSGRCSVRTSDLCRVNANP